MPILKIFKDSFILLGKQPKLFLPKIIVAFLYGLIMIITASFVLALFPALNAKDYAALATLFFYDLLLLVFLFVVLCIDVFTNAMYPQMVKDFFDNKGISFSRAFSSVKGKFVKIFLSAILLEFLLAIPFSLISVVLILSKNFVLLTVFVIIFLVLYLIIASLFYFVYPLLVLESVFFFKNFSASFSMTKKKLPKVFLASLLPFAISLVNFALAFVSQRWEFLLVFLLMRLLIAIMQTYNMVLNPSIFLKYKDI